MSRRGVRVEAGEMIKVVVSGNHVADVKVAYQLGVWAVTEHVPKDAKLWTVTHAPSGRAAFGLGLAEARDLCRRLWTRWPRWQAKAQLSDTPTPPAAMRAMRDAAIAAGLQG